MDYLHELHKHIRKHCVTDMASILDKFPGRSVPSFHRDLARLGCISSFTDNRRFYTLPEIPSYDGFGLWRHNGIGFSKYGTAKETARVLIEGSSSGMTYADLEGILGIRLYTTLQTLSAEKVIISETDGNRKLFFSGCEENYQRQKSSRRGISAPNSGHPFNLLVVVDLLLAVINEDADTIDKAYMLLRFRNHPYLTREEVGHIFEHYHLPGKKN
jgi:hypothetical protein